MKKEFISCDSIKIKKFPGGTFLVVKINEDSRFGKWKENKPKISSNLANPNSHVIVLNGKTKRKGAYVFLLDNIPYTRVYKHKVEGKPLSKYSLYYRTHSSPWGNTSGKMALQVCEEPYLKFK